MRLDPGFSAAYGLVAVRKRRKRPTIINPRSGRSPSPTRVTRSRRYETRSSTRRTNRSRRWSCRSARWGLPQHALDRLAAATGPADARAGPTAAVVVHRNVLIRQGLANGSEGLPHCAEAGHHHREGRSPPSRRLVTTTAHVGPPSANAMPPTAAARSRRPQAGPPGPAVAHPHCSGDAARR